MVPAPMRTALLAVALAASAAACSPPGGGTTTSATTSSSTTTTGDLPTSSGTTDLCEGSADCDSEGICVAGYTPSADPEHPGGRGPAACVDGDACIAALDLERWCFDHQGCCESLRCRTADGVCEPPELGQTNSNSSGGADTTSTSTDSDSTADSNTTAADTDDTTDSSG